MTKASLKLIANCLATSALAISLVACGSSASTSFNTLPSSGATVSALTGSYVFSISGSDPNDGDYFVLGDFTADGKGNITSGVADYNLGSGIDPNVPLKGTYTVSNGVATVQLTGPGTLQDSFSVNVSSSTPTTMAVFNFDQNGSGTLYPVTAGFSQAGTYTFSVKGEGEGTVTGSGTAVANATGMFTSGNLTYTDAQTTSTYATVPGFVYPPAATGRGQAAIEGNNLAYYAVSPSQVFLIGLDQRALLLFTAQKM